jgi:hypothetical protein
MIRVLDEDGNEREVKSHHVKAVDVNEDGTVSFPLSGCEDEFCKCGEEVEE